MSFSLILAFLSYPTGISASTEGAAISEKGVQDRESRSISVATELNADILFNVLMGEVAGHREQLDAALGYYQEAARLSGDALVAERAVTLALLTKKLDQAEVSVGQWIDLAPESLEARQFAVAIALQRNKYQPAARHLKALIAQAKEKKANGFILAARALSKAVDKQWALQQMNALVSKDATDPEAWYAHAILAAEFKSNAEAIKAVDRAITLKPNWHKAVMLKVKLYWGRGEKDEAIKMLARVVAKDGDNRELRYTYARFLVDASRHEQALKQFQIIWDQDRKAGKKGFNVRYALAVLAMELERHQQAKKHFVALQATAKYRNEAAYFLGRIAEEVKDSAAAIAWFKKVREGDYEFEAKLRIAENLAKTGKLAEARELLRKLRGHRPSHAVRIYIIESSLLKDAKSPEAEVFALFETGLKEHPEDLELLYTRALYAATLPRIDILERDLRIVIEKMPKHANALNALGYTLADLTDRLPEAADYIRRALDLKPESPAILDSMGWVNYRMGKIGEALKFLKKAHALLLDPEIASHYGEVLWKSGSRRQARKVWRKAWKEFADNEILRKTLKRFGIKFK